MEKQGGPGSSSLKALQSARQRDLLDAIDQLRNCGIDNELSLPQLVVCGDQSAGKSSVLEALTEINFPRADNLCTRFATEIIMRRAKSAKLSVRIIPDTKRSTEEQSQIKEFTSSVTDFSDITSQLANIISEAQEVMGIGDGTDGVPARTFALDVLSIEIEGPDRPQLTVVDLPGMIQNENNAGDKELVDGLTKQYINQPRAICLAIITAMNDADNQRVLTMVRAADPEGRRSLGIITKPDTLPSGSGSEKSFIELADNQNKSYFFKLGWHVVKNRKYEETEVSFFERNRLEGVYFDKSNFKSLPKSSVGIEALRTRLSEVLLQHVGQELPGIRAEVEKMLDATRQRLKNLGMSRTSKSECREYLIQVGEKMKDLCKCALSGSYDDKFFQPTEGLGFELSLDQTPRRLRATVQLVNEDFAERMRKESHTLQIEAEPEGESKSFASNDKLAILQGEATQPIELPYTVALTWVRRMMELNRGRELYGNYNPILISELFWFQSRRWEDLAKTHVDGVANICSSFLHGLLGQVCSDDVRDRIWAQRMEESLKSRESKAYDFLEKMMRTHRDHPINHNHYYTETIQKIRQQREQDRFKLAMVNSVSQMELNHGSREYRTADVVDQGKALEKLSAQTTASQLLFSCEEALDCMRSIYKVKQKVFIDNILTLVIEEHIFRDLENIFSPQVVNRLSDEEVDQLAAEPEGVQRERAHYRNQLERLEHGQKILKSVINRGMVAHGTKVISKELAILGAKASKEEGTVFGADFPSRNKDEESPSLSSEEAL